MSISHDLVMGDTAVVIEATLEINGSAVDLTSAAVTLQCKSISTGATTELNASVYSASAGILRCTPTEAFLSTADSYHVRVKVVFGDGKVKRFPTKPPIRLNVLAAPP